MLLMLLGIYFFAPGQTPQYSGATLEVWEEQNGEHQLVVDWDLWGEGLTVPTIRKIGPFEFEDRSKLEILNCSFQMKDGNELVMDWRFEGAGDGIDRYFVQVWTRSPDGKEAERVSHVVGLSPQRPTRLLHDSNGTRVVLLLKEWRDGRGR